ncbi:MAG: asparagine--tRNA ligase [Bdellovibrionales bacterium]|nr:asparagine--tRNA ligase [Bdellovibrionales bacterium]
MQPEIYVEDIFRGARQENDTVRLMGWVYNTRSSGKVKFLLFRDGTGIIQCVLFPANTDAGAYAAFETLTQETALEVEGFLTKSPKAAGGWELQVKNFKVIGSSVDYPITPKEHGPAFLLDHRHLWIRSKMQNAILRIRSEVIAAVREYFDDRGFVNFDAPIFTPNACEGTSELFGVNYFDDKAYLTQSGQLYGEAGAMAFGKAYVFGPTFRAEKSKTRRHLTEFWMVEPEVAFMDLEGNMQLAEGMICHIVERVLRTRRRELEALERDFTKLEVVKAPFPRIHYKEAGAILEKESKDNFKMGMDFGGGDETILAERFDRPFFVHGFPTAIKAFYMKEDPTDPTYTLSCDLLAPEGYGEIIGGSQREESIDVLKRKIASHGLDQKVFEWYLDLRRFGSVPHSGFGMGIERCTAWICGIQHVRETIPFPRLLNRLNP